MAAHILKAAKDPKFDSIVLRINSPGGFPRMGLAN
jgi:ClpP class serine protease